MGFFLVEPLVALYSFSYFLLYPVVQQYVYWRLWQKITNTTAFLSESPSSCTANISSNQSLYQEEVQKQASLFSVYNGIASAPSFAVTVILVAYSDQRGRRIAIIMPIIGAILYALYILMVSYFELNVYLLIVGTLISSLFGGYGTFFGGCLSYTTDLCEGTNRKTVRMAGVELALGASAGLAALLSGYFIRAAGFNWPFFTCALCQCFLLLFVIFILEETVEMAPSDAGHLGGLPQYSFIKQTLYGVYKLFSQASCRRNTILGLLIVILTTTSLAYMGGLSMVILYELNEPLCFDEILIGYSSAMVTSVFLTSFLGVWVLTYFNVRQLVIVLLGILSVMAGTALVAFSKTTLMMFLSRSALFLSAMPFPVLRAMMSTIVSQSEQGALFACVSCVESLFATLPAALFGRVYSATVDWCPGFTFLLAAGICLIPLLLLGVLAWFGVSVEEAEEQQPLLSEAAKEEQGIVSEEKCLLSAEEPGTPSAGAAGEPGTPSAGAAGEPGTPSAGAAGEPGTPSAGAAGDEVLS